MHLEEKSLHAKAEACFPLDHRTEVCGCSVYPVRPLQGSLVTDPDPGWAALSPQGTFLTGLERLSQEHPFLRQPRRLGLSSDRSGQIGAQVLWIKLPLSSALSWIRINFNRVSLPSSKGAPFSTLTPLAAPPSRSEPCFSCQGVPALATRPELWTWSLKSPRPECACLSVAVPVCKCVWSCT